MKEVGMEVSKEVRKYVSTIHDCTSGRVEKLTLLDRLGTPRGPQGSFF